MKAIKVLIIGFLAALIIWIDLPENLKIYNFELNPLNISTKIFGIEVKKEFKTHLGLDLKGGSHLVFQADTSKVKSADLQDALNSSRDIIERRVNFYGVSEPTIQTIQSGSIHRIVVDLPGITNVEEAVGLIGKTAQLSFQEILTIPGENGASPSAALKSTGLTGKDVQKAAISFSQETGKPEVALTFTKNGTKLFGEITTRNVGKPVLIFLDNNILTQPTVQQPILDGNAVITGDFTTDEAKQLAISINSGALPLPIKLIEQRNIGPTLGATEVQKSVYAGIVGLIAVMVFMVIYYRRLGLIACLALIIYGLISLAIFRAIPVVLTLSGIAGFILSIGMAVDSNILIFERIKEELRAGKDFDTAIRLGFGRAIDAIKDANFTTLIVGFILFNPLNWSFFPQFGLVRGFALTLMVGVGVSLFTGVFITRRLINVFYKKPGKFT